MRRTPPSPTVERHPVHGALALREVRVGKTISPRRTNYEDLLYQLELVGAKGTLATNSFSSRYPLKVVQSVKEISF